MTTSSQTRESARHEVSSADFSQKSEFKQLLGSLFGFDLFISYAWADARDYAVELAEKLESAVDGKKYSCFLDSEDYTKGDDWKQAGKEALERTSLLVLVGSPKALESAPVLREVSIYTERKRRIIPIEFVDGDGRGTLDSNHTTSEVHKFIRPEILRIKEPKQYREDAPNQLAGPSEEVVRQIAESFDSITQSDKRVRVFGTAALVFAFVAVMAVVFWRSSEANFDEAKRQEQLAIKQKEEAERQTVIARAGQLAAQSQAAFQQPEQLYNSVHLALASWRLAPSSEAMLSLRRGLALLPHQVQCLKHDQGITTAAFSPDGGYLASGSNDMKARIWNVRAPDRKPQRTFLHTPQTVAIQRGHAAPEPGDVHQLSFSQDGRYLATAIGDGSAHVWEIPSGRSIHRFAHSSLIRTLEFCPVGAYLLTVESDNVAWVWDVPRGLTIASITHPAPFATYSGQPGTGNTISAAFTRDGSRFVTGSRHSTVHRVWIWRPDEVNAIARVRLNALQNAPVD